MAEVSISKNSLRAFYMSLGQKLNEERLSSKYGFEKPNDRRALDLMNAAAVAVMTELPDIRIAYGISDEYRSINLVKSIKTCHNLVILVLYLIASANSLKDGKG